MRRNILLSLLALLPIVANAYDAYIDGIYYNFSGDEAIVTQGGDSSTPYSGVITIPSSVTYGGKSYSVTSIGARAFSWCGVEITVTIPNSVTSIGDYAFYYSSGLTSITIPKSVTSIGSSAFLGCSGLTSVTIECPNVGSWFSNLSSIQNVTFGEKVVSIGENAFQCCNGLTSITMGNGVTSIGENAFQYCTSLSSITIRSSVATIGKCAFSGCSGLTSIKVESGNTIYDSRNNCNAIIETATNSLIAGCKNTFIPHDVVSIGEGAFYQCNGLTSITIPDNVVSIGREAFSGCNGLISATIGNSVTTIGNFAFSGCNALASINIPNSVTSIGSWAFMHCNNLTSIAIPDKVTSIGEDAFFDCTGLQKVVVPDIAIWCGMTFGNYNANPLSYAHHLFINEETEITELVIPDDITSIGNSAFSGCSYLTSITIHRNVTRIGNYAFNGCSGMIDVFCYAEKVPSTGNNVFSDSSIETATLHVSRTALDKYRVTLPWSNFGKIMSIDGYTPEPMKCATPTIAYQNGQLIFQCETENVEFVSEITDTDIKKNFTAIVNLTATYDISVYASKAGYENSDTIQAALCWINQEPEKKGVGIIDVNALPVLIQTQGGTFTIQGTAEGTPIAIYDTNGKEYGYTTSEKERTNIATSLRPGSVAVVKIGEKAVKVLLK